MNVQIAWFHLYWFRRVAMKAKQTKIFKMKNCCRDSMALSHNLYMIFIQILYFVYEIYQKLTIWLYYSYIPSIRRQKFNS